MNKDKEWLFILFLNNINKDECFEQEEQILTVSSHSNLIFFFFFFLFVEKNWKN